MKKRSRSRRAREVAPAAPTMQPMNTKASTAEPKPGSTLRIAVTLPRPDDGLGLTQSPARLTTSTVEAFVPDPLTLESACAELERLGFTVSQIGRVSISARGPRYLFERTFGTKLSVFRFDDSEAGQPAQEAFYYPAPDAPWKPKRRIAELIDAAYIQWPYYFTATQPSPIPPQVDYHHLRVPGDVTLLLDADRVHRDGITGHGVRVAMVDSGFAFGHPYYQGRGYRTSVVLAPGASEPEADGNGHGTGEAANLLAIAPDVTFVGVKLDNETRPNESASLLEGFQVALAQNPSVISVSLGFDLVKGPTRQHLEELPNGLKALEAEVQAAVADGIAVVFSAGNGHVAFPGMMPSVISAGGTFVDADDALIASDYASAFPSSIYVGRHVPDFTGLVGLAANGASYIMLPIQSGSDLDTGGANRDGTAPDDGWAVFSGTSAAAPQLAGVCALLLEQDPSLSPADIKNALARTARDVTQGTANPASNEGTALEASAGPDGATGAGLVDAYEALRQV
jgi:subtilisin family serine protease